MMSSAFSANDQAIDELAFQRHALDPARSVVIEACAGSGKTWLLVSRVMRLLLAGVAPQQILALTFTRKAAQEMRTRLLTELEHWATADDAEVLASLQQRALAPHEALAQLAHARGLYEAVLNTPRGITLDTFHGWFASVLRHAPLASGVSADFTLLEHTGRWVDQAWQEFSFLLQQPRHATQRSAFAQLMQLLGQHQTRKLLINLLHRRAEWWTYCGGASAPQHAAGIERVCAALRSSAAAQGVVVGDTPPLPVPIPDSLLQALEGVRDILLDQGAANATMAELLNALVEWLKLHHSGQIGQLDETTFASLGSIFLTKADNQPRKILHSAWSKKLAGLLPRYLECVECILATLAQLQAQYAEWNTLQLNRHALLCGGLLIDCYQQQKAQLGSLDFNDLEWQVHRLMHDSEHAAYLQTRLDARYKHILIDEFQDTNPMQWGVLNSWLEAYGGDAQRPQLFIVGDPKQSIYRFRRAEPRLFAEVARQLQQSHDALLLRTNQTRRNSRCVVDVLNAVLPGNPRYQAQQTLNREAGGFVLLPQIAAQAIETPAAPADSDIDPAWRDALTTARPDDARDERYQEGLAVARQLRALLPTLQIEQNKTVRAASYGDVMILVPRRSHLAEYERALRECGLPFVSDRSGGLLNTLEASDLRALLSWLGAPYQNLCLAQILRSPLFDCSDEDLLQLARQAPQPWWQTLQECTARQQASSVLLRAGTLLADWLRQAGVLPVHDLLDRIYHQGQAMARYTARSPAPQVAQVQANLNQFLSLALMLDAGRYPSLPAFLDELKLLERASDQEAPDEGATAAGNAIRILTVHGAKGLEAPVVAVMDCSATAREEHLGVLLDWPAGAARPAHFSLHLSARRRGLSQQEWLTREAEVEQQEDWNLLYVALTRAAQWLLVSATQSRQTSRSEGLPDWYTLLQAASDFSASLPETAAPNDDSAGPQMRQMIDLQPQALHIGSRQPAVPESAAQRLGSAWHHVMEQIREQVRPPQHRDYFPSAAALATQFDLTGPEAELALTAAHRVLDNPALAHFFDPDRHQTACNEMTVATAEGALKRIDRWVIGAQECWVLDYKWQVTAPERAAYAAQVRAYAAALQPHARTRRLRCGLITHEAELIEIPI